MRFASVLLTASFVLSVAAVGQSVPAAIYTDPAPDPAHPASMAVLHIPSHGVQINALLYAPSGAGPHPTLVICHGLPGNEKNLDLAQVVRRAGWNAVTFNYRGSWGSPGDFRFKQNLEDAPAVLAYLTAPENARRLGIDPGRIVLAGHSMGGWVAANTAAQNHALAGLILISAADMSADGHAMSHAALVHLMADNMEALAGVTAESMAAELAGDVRSADFAHAAPGLAKMPLLVITANDGLAPQDDALAKQVKAEGNRDVTAMHMDTDHSYSGRRILLEATILNWLQAHQTAH